MDGYSFSNPYIYRERERERATERERGERERERERARARERAREKERGSPYTYADATECESILLHFNTYVLYRTYESYTGLTKKTDRASISAKDRQCRFRNRDM
jgi:hypothetical protein